MKRAAFWILGVLGTALLVWLALFHNHPAPDRFKVARWVLFVALLPALVKMVIMIVVAPWNQPLQARRDRVRPARLAPPRVTAIVPAYNEEVGIGVTVRSLLASTHRELDVIVVDDGSTDRTGDVVRALVAEAAADPAGPRITYLHQANAGKSHALNHGLSRATGDIVVTVDADSMVEPDFVARLVDRFADPEVMCVAGNVRIGNPGSVIGWVQKLEYLMGFFTKNADSLLGSVYIVGGAAAAYRREVFDVVGPFATDIITEDIEMSTRIQDAGLAIAYAPRALVHTEGPSSLTGLAKQRLRWKHGRLITFSRYRHLFFSTAPRHNRWLAWMMLPIALAGELMLLIEPLIVAFTLGTALILHDLVPIVAYLGVLMLVALGEIVLDVRRRDNGDLLWLLPIVWLPLLLVDAIELQALVRSLVKLARGHEVAWQRWDRTGVLGQQQSGAVATGAVRRGDSTPVG